MHKIPITMKKLFIIISLTFIICVFTSNGTYAQFQLQSLSQFNSQAQLLNPSLTGGEADESRLALTYRDRGTNFTNLFSSTHVAFDMPISICNEDNTHFGIGIIGGSNHSEQNTLTRRTVALSFAYHQLISNGWQLSAGTQFGYRQEKTNFSNFLADPIAILPINNSFSHGYLNFGLSSTTYFSEKSSLQIGASYNHNFKPSSEKVFFNFDDPLISQATIHLTSRFGLGAKTSISPSLLHIQKGELNLQIAGFSVGLHIDENNDIGSSNIHAGVWYRSDDAAIFLIGADVDRFSLNASYDLSTGLLDISNTRGAFEISFIYQGNSKDCQK